MKTTMKVLAAILPGVAGLFLSNYLIPVFAVVKGIADRSTFRVMIILNLLILALVSLIFRAMKRKAPKIRSLGDILQEGRMTETALMVPGQPAGACYQPMNGRTFLLLLCAMGAAQTLLRSYTGWPSSSGAEAELYLDRNAVGLYLLGTCIVTPAVGGILYQGLLQRNLMKYGAFYAVLLSGLSYALFLGNTSLKAGPAVFALFYGFVAAKYGLKWSVLMHIIHAFGQVIPKLITVRFRFPGTNFVCTMNYIFERIACYGFMVFLLWLLVRLVRTIRRPEAMLQRLGRKAVVKADGSLTMVFFLGVYILGNLMVTLAMAICGISV